MSERGVSTVVSYVLALGILAILVSGLVVSFAPFVTNQQQDTAQSTMQVLGNDIAGDLDTADRLANTGGETETVKVRTQLPERISGSTYEIEIESVNGNTYDIILRADDFEASAYVRVRTQLSVETDTVDGGDILIEYDGDELVITDV